jgi:arsenate reductase-like glutaredoxin family protein
MVWALLFALIFGGGSQSVLLNPDLKKHIRKFVENKENKKQLLTITKSYEKEAKAFIKKEKKMVKQMGQLNSQRTTTEEEFREFFTNAITQYKEFQQKGLECRLEIQQLLTESESMQIFKASEESWKKSEKTREKWVIRLRKQFDKLNSKINKQVQDQTRRDQTIEIVDEFRNNLIDIKCEYDKFNIIDNPILKKHDATKSELQTELDLQNELRCQFYNVYIENHSKLVNFTTEEEWDKVIKSVNRIF